MLRLGNLPRKIYDSHQRLFATRTTKEQYDGPHQDRPTQETTSDTRFLEEFRREHDLPEPTHSDAHTKNLDGDDHNVDYAPCNIRNRIKTKEET